MIDDAAKRQNAAEKAVSGEEWEKIAKKAREDRQLVGRDMPKVIVSPDAIPAKPGRWDRLKSFFGIIPKKSKEKLKKAA